jgi:hypothetical protein
MPALFKSYTKGILSNRNLWFWGVLVMVFYIVLDTYSFSQGIPDTQPYLLQFAAVIYGSIALFSLSALSVSVASSIYYASFSLAYGFRYTKLSPTSYLRTLVGSSSILGVFLGLVMLACTFGIDSVKFGFDLAPIDPVGALLTSAVAGVFMMTFAVLLVTVVVNYVGLRSVALVSFVPLILALGLGLGALSTGLPAALIYASPYNAIQSLLFMTYSGVAPRTALTNTSAATLQWPYLAVSLVAWIAALFILDALLLRRIKPRQVEEGRQI